MQVQGYYDSDSTLYTLFLLKVTGSIVAVSVDSIFHHTAIYVHVHVDVK